MSFNGHTAKRRAKAVELYLAGATPARIATTVGYSEQYVRIILCKCGAMPVGATGRGRSKKAETPEPEKLAAKKGKK